MFLLLFVVLTLDFIAVTISLAITIFGIITVAVLELVHVDVVDHGSQFRE